MEIFWTILKHVHYHLVSDSNLGPRILAVRKTDSTLFLMKSQGTALRLAVCISLHYPVLQGTLQYFIPFSKKTYCFTVSRFGKHTASKGFTWLLPRRETHVISKFQRYVLPQDSVICIGTTVHVPQLYDVYFCKKLSKILAQISGYCGSRKKNHSQNTVN
jgi:hypothetical protein